MPFKMHEVPTAPLPNFHTGCTVLGNRNLAESLVEWSKKKRPGTKFVKETSWGLVLHFIANLAEPMVLVTLSVSCLRRFLSQWGPTSRICVESYGFQMFGPIDLKQKEALLSEHTPVAITHGTTVDADCPVVFQFWPGHTTEEDRLLGIISLTENGFFWLTAQEAEEFVTKGNITLEKHQQTAHKQASAHVATAAQNEDEPVTCNISMTPEELAACENS
jgi:hypothetical protein